MNDDTLERELREWYRAEVDETVTASSNLRTAVRSIPILDVRARRVGSGGRPGMLLIAAAIATTAVVGSALVGSGFLRPTPDAPRASLAAIVAPSPSAPATAEPSQQAIADSHGGWLVFSTKGRIVVARGDGSDRHELSDGSVDDYFPAWSPDGRQIAFFSQDCVSAEACPDKVVDSMLVVINADGSGRRGLRSGLRNPVYLRWLQDGSGVVETAFRANGRTITERVGLDGSVGTGAEAVPATWVSPDGTEVVRLDADERTIQISKADGTNKRVLVRTDPSGGPLAIVGWSPDGKSIAYDVISPTVPHFRKTWTVGRDGSGARAWAELPEGGRLVGWSADGLWMLVAVPVEGQVATDHFVIAAADGSGPRVFADPLRLFRWTSRDAWLLGVREVPTDGGVRGSIVVVDPRNPVAPVEIDAPNLLGLDWRADT